jgi:hypothetical protein
MLSLHHKKTCCEIIDSNFFLLIVIKLVNAESFEDINMSNPLKTSSSNLDNLGLQLSTSLSELPDYLLPFQTPLAQTVAPAVTQTSISPSSLPVTSLLIVITILAVIPLLIGIVLIILPVVLLLVGLICLHAHFFSDKKGKPKKKPKSRKACDCDHKLKGLPKASQKERGCNRVKRMKRSQVLSNKKTKKLAKRRDMRTVRLLQEHQREIDKAWQNQKPPPYRISEFGMLRKPEQEDMAVKAWKDKQQAEQQAKIARQEHVKCKVKFDALSPEDKEKFVEAKSTRWVAFQQHLNTLTTRQQIHFNTKAIRKKGHLAANQTVSTTAWNAYSQVQGMPRCDAEFTSPQGSEYSPFCAAFVFSMLTPTDHYTGRDVHQAIFALGFSLAKGKVGYHGLTGKVSRAKKRVPKIFKNEANPDDMTPLPGVSAAPPLMEFPMLHDKKVGHDGRKPVPSEAHVIIQENVYRGLVGHPPGSLDARYHSYFDLYLGDDFRYYIYNLEDDVVKSIM